MATFIILLPAIYALFVLIFMLLSGWYAWAEMLKVLEKIPQNMQMPVCNVCWGCFGFGLSLFFFPLMIVFIIAFGYYGPEKTQDKPTAPPVEEIRK